MSNKNVNSEAVKALKKARATDKLLDGDLSIDVGFFDNQGRYDTAQFIRWIFGFYFISFWVMALLFLAYAYVNFQHPFSSYIELVFKWWYGNTKALLAVSGDTVNTDYQFILTTSLIVGSVLTYLLIKKQRFKGEVQSFLSSNNLSQYYLKSYNKKTREAYFKLIKGQPANFKGFMDNADNFKQMFKVGKLKAGREQKTGVLMQFLEETPRLIVKYKGKEYTMQQQEEMVSDGVPKTAFSVKSTCRRTDFSKELVGYNKSMLGVKDINGKALYCAFPATVGMIQGHTLIGGGTGSGKSFMTTNWIKSALMGETAQYIDEVIVINMKEDSPDWDFLKGYERASLYTGVEEALVALKKAELKMLANNRWNSVYGEENTNYGQTIVIIDEIHKFQLIMNDRTQPQTVKLVAGKCNTIIDTLATQARSANLFIIAILQKATLDQLSGTFRSNAMNRILLKSDKISSGVIIDEEVQEENMIDSQKITSGQFIYYNMQNGLINEGFAVEAVKWDLEKANSLEQNPKLIEGREQAKDLIEQAKVVAQLKANQAEEDKNDKDFANKVNDYGAIELETRDYWKEAQDILSGEAELETTVAEEDEEIKAYREKLKKMGNAKNDLEEEEESDKPIETVSFIKKKEEPKKEKSFETKFEIKTPKIIQEEATEEETEKFLGATEDIMELEEKLENFEEVEKKAEENLKRLEEIEENPQEELKEEIEKEKLSQEDIQDLEEKLKQAKQEITIDI